MTTLTHLSDAELLRHAEAQLDPLTSTDLERELIRRFADCVGRDELFGDFDEPDAEILRFLRAEGYEEVDQVKQAVTMFGRLKDVAEQIDESTLTTLNTLLSEVIA